MRTPAPLDSTAVLAALPRSASGAEQYEFSVKASGGKLARWGRFAVWLDGAFAENQDAIADWLSAIGAPGTVRAAHAAAPRPLRQGAAVSIEEGRIEYRLYLHGLKPGSQADDYEALRWSPGEEQARSCRYIFHFAPETPEGDRPETLVPEWAADGVAALAHLPEMQRASGFWVRTDSNGARDQIDLATIWNPLVGDLRGAGDLLDRTDISDADRTWLEPLPVRHVAVPMGSRPSVTFYASALLDAVPTTEATLQTAVIATAGHTRQIIAAHLSGLPPQPPIAGDRGEIDHFYSGEIALWQAALGRGMHYHHGLFAPGDGEPDDATMLAASRRAVTELYPFIAEGTSVYDIGCGWGGPLAVLARERGCRALGATIARNQFRHVSSLGLPVRWADAERTVPPGRFDCALLLESFEHVQDKPALLRLLALFTGRLVMRVNCQDMAPPSTNFGGSMPMVSSVMLRAMLEEAGWNVVHWQDRRMEAMPSAAAWSRRLSALPETGDQHLETFRDWAARVVRLGGEWGKANPLIEVVAER